MNTLELLQTAWVWHPWVVAGGALGFLCYGALRWCAPRESQCLSEGGGRRTLYFLAGLAVGLLALVSPVEALADGYLFSAHMLQHLLLLLVVPPLLLLSVPAFSERENASPGAWGFIGRAVTWPWLTWILGTSAMWIWHTPTLCNAATTSSVVHGVQVLTLLVIGGLFWWPICGPQASRRIPTLTGVLYLFTACLACTIQGIILTFSPIEVCSIYSQPVDRLGILPLIRDGWGFTHEVDRKVGGLLMWVPACVLYLSAIMGMLIHWFSASTAEAKTPPGPTAPPTEGTIPPKEIGRGK